MRYGCDISEHQTIKDYKPFKSLDFVIIREGYRQSIDKKFISHVKGMNSVDVPIHSVYHFIYALTVGDAIKEARSCAINIKKAGLPDDIMVWADLEYDSIDKAKAKGIEIGNKEINSFTVAFCEEMKSLGHPVGIYTNIDFYKNHYTQDTLSKYPLWLAATGGTVGLVAGSVAAVAWAMKTSHWKIPNYDQLMSDAETLKGEIESIQTDINNIDVAIKNVDVNAQPIEYLREELHKCFEENGSLKTGMEETASYIMGELNAAMGTDLSTTFTTNMDANKSKLAEVDQAIDSYIGKMKEAAITQTFTSEYANALTAEKEAATAAAEAYDALLDTYTRMSEAEAQLAQDKINYANGVEIDVEANANLRRELVSLTEVFDEQTQNYVEAAGAAAEASGEVNGLETAMEMLASADPAERSKAAGGIRWILNDISEKTGVENIHPHRFRRTLATDLLNKGMAIQDVSKVLGHANVSITQAYYYHTDEKVEKEFRKFI